MSTGGRIDPIRALFAIIPEECLKSDCAAERNEFEPSISLIQPISSTFLFSVSWSMLYGVLSLHLATSHDEVRGGGMIDAGNSQPWPNSALYNHGLGGVIFDRFRRPWGMRLGTLPLGGKG
jgi:hypothetical protein